MKLISFFSALLLMVACASTSVTQVSRNQIIVSTSAAPVCGGAGASKVASKMAAIETIKHGFERFIIIGGGLDNNTKSIYVPPTQSYTYGTYGRGNYSAQTRYYGGGIQTYGTHDASLNVVMLNRGDRGYQDGVDAKRALGDDWETLVEKGLSTCS